MLYSSVQCYTVLYNTVWDPVQQKVLFLLVTTDKKWEDGRRRERRKMKGKVKRVGRRQIPDLLDGWCQERPQGGDGRDDIRKDYEFAITGTFLKTLHRQVDEHLRMEKAENTGRGKIGKTVWKVDKVLLNRKDESWSPKAAVYSSVYSSSQSQPRVRAGGTK